MGKFSCIINEFNQRLYAEIVINRNLRKIPGFRLICPDNLHVGQNTYEYLCICLNNHESVYDEDKIVEAIKRSSKGLLFIIKNTEGVNSFFTRKIVEVLNNNPQILRILVFILPFRDLEDSIKCIKSRIESLSLREFYFDSCFHKVIIFTFHHTHQTFIEKLFGSSIDSNDANDSAHINRIIKSTGLDCFCFPLNITHGNSGVLNIRMRFPEFEKYIKSIYGKSLLTGNRSIIPGLLPPGLQTGLIRKSNVIEEISLKDIIRNIPSVEYSIKNTGGKETTDFLSCIIWEFLNSRPGIISGSGRKPVFSQEIIADYRRKISSFISRGMPVEIKFSAFAPKYTNPLISGGDTQPDLSYLLVIQHLLDISRAIMKIYPPGIRYQILYEGTLYRECGLYTKAETEQCLQQIKFFIKELEKKNGLINRITVTDYYELCRQYDFDRQILLEKEQLEEIYRSSSDQEIKKEIDDWAENFLPNVIDYNRLAGKFGYSGYYFSFSDHFLLFSKLQPEKKSHQGIIPIFKRVFIDYALLYRAIRHTIRKYSSEKRILPDALDAAIRNLSEFPRLHIKLYPQFAFFPHQGITIWNGRQWNITRIADLCFYPGLYSGVNIREKDLFCRQPFFYLMNNSVRPGICPANNKSEKRIINPLSEELLYTLQKGRKNTGKYRNNWKKVLEQVKNAKAEITHVHVLKLFRIAESAAHDTSRCIDILKILVSIGMCRGECINSEIICRAEYLLANQDLNIEIYFFALRFLTAVIEGRSNEKIRRKCLGIFSRLFSEYEIKKSVCSDRLGILISETGRLFYLRSIDKQNNSEFIKHIIDFIDNNFTRDASFLTVCIINLAMQIAKTMPSEITNEHVAKIKSIAGRRDPNRYVYRFIPSFFEALAVSRPNLLDNSILDLLIKMIMLEKKPSVISAAAANAVFSSRMGWQMKNTALENLRDYLLSRSFSARDNACQYLYALGVFAIQAPFCIPDDFIRNFEQKFYNIAFSDFRMLQAFCYAYTACKLADDKYQKKTLWDDNGSLLSSLADISDTDILKAFCDKLSVSTGGGNDRYFRLDTKLSAKLKSMLVNSENPQNIVYILNIMTLADGRRPKYDSFLLERYFPNGTARIWAELILLISRLNDRYNNIIYKVTVGQSSFTKNRIISGSDIDKLEIQYNDSSDDDLVENCRNEFYKGLQSIGLHYWKSCTKWVLRNESDSSCIPIYEDGRVFFREFGESDNRSMIRNRKILFDSFEYLSASEKILLLMIHGLAITQNISSGFNMDYIKDIQGTGRMDINYLEEGLSGGMVPTLYLVNTEELGILFQLEKKEFISIYRDTIQPLWIASYNKISFMYVNTDMISENKKSKKSKKVFTDTLQSEPISYDKHYCCAIIDFDEFLFDAETGIKSESNLLKIISLLSKGVQIALISDHYRFSFIYNNFLHYIPFEYRHNILIGQMTRFSVTDGYGRVLHNESAKKEQNDEVFICFYRKYLKSVFGKQEIPEEMLRITRSGNYDFLPDSMCFSIPGGNDMPDIIKTITERLYRESIDLKEILFHHRGEASDLIELYTDRGNYIISEERATEQLDTILETSRSLYG